jgi:predicted chitinase
MSIPFLTLEGFKAIFPRMAKNPKTAAIILPPLVAAMDSAGINTKLRVAAFLAQIGHECGEFKYKEEIWGPTEAQKRYEPPSTLAKKLGNTEKGDGYKYRGRSVLQLTGKSNYAKFGKILGIDLVDFPDKAAEWDTGFKIAAAYWNDRKINDPADIGDFKEVTRRVNGGANGLLDRQKFYDRALAIL